MIRGQSCENCLCFDTATADAIGMSSEMGICKAARTTIFSAADEWCGHWRGNAEVRCGACKWFGRGECPRTVSIEPVGERGNIKFFAQATEIAFPCERWETPE